MTLRLVVFVVLGVSAIAGPCHAQTPSATASPFGIADNSFLIEEAFNQERGVFQNIFVYRRVRESLCPCPVFMFGPQNRTRWDAAFTQEWPVGGMRHQLSYTVPFSGERGERRLDDIAVNYRFQLKTEGPGHPAISPRLSVIVPSTTGDLGDNEWGVQANLPVSKRVGRLYFHFNAGATWQRADEHHGSSARELRWRMSPALGGSAILALRPMVHLMLETLVNTEPDGNGGRDASTTISPGLRTGWNFGEKQFVVGAAVPISLGAERSVALLGYVSYELRFTR
jgi:hypothetical protein